MPPYGGIKSTLLLTFAGCTWMILSSRDVRIFLQRRNLSAILLKTLGLLLTSVSFSWSLSTSRSLTLSSSKELALEHETSSKLTCSISFSFFVMLRRLLGVTDLCLRPIVIFSRSLLFLLELWEAERAFVRQPPTIFTLSPSKRCSFPWLNLPPHRSPLSLYCAPLLSLVLRFSPPPTLALAYKKSVNHFTQCNPVISEIIRRNTVLLNKSQGFTKR